MGRFSRSRLSQSKGPLTYCRCRCDELSVQTARGATVSTGVLSGRLVTCLDSARPVAKLTRFRRIFAFFRHPSGFGTRRALPGMWRELNYLCR